MRSIFYAFVVNEYYYKRIVFSRHYTEVAAQASAYRPYKGNAESDFDATVIEGKDALISWAKECNYYIDWKHKTLNYLGGN